MKFEHEIAELQFDPNGIALAAGKNIQSNDDLFFRAKQREITEQYYAARIFMLETEKDPSDYWYEAEGAEKDQITEMNYAYKGIFYESALMYYNIIVDLSWVMTYACIEFVFRSSEVDFMPLKGMQVVDEARKSLAKLEELTVSPGSEENPFQYLKRLAPQFCEVIDITKSFWDSYANHQIRSRYNYIKHRGKPLYEEVSSEYTCYILRENKGRIERVASGIRDVSEVYSLERAIEELFKFDNEMLFPYVKNLIMSLDKIICPSIAV